MNNLNNYSDIDNINSQLERADKQKRILIRNIYREYELYLNLMRDLLNSSVDKGLNEIYSYSSINKNFINEKELFCLFKKKISKMVYSKLPLLTIEQLKINEIEKNLNKEIKIKTLEGAQKTKDKQKEKFHYEDYSKLDENIQFRISKDISNTSEYYQAQNYEKLASLDLDNNEHNNYLSKENIIENIGVENQSIPSLVELIEEVEFEKSRYSEKENINQRDNIQPKHKSLKIFDLIDKSLENFLLNFSYKINQELFKANLINKMISKDSFEYLVGKKLIVKHPLPFVINFDFNLYKSSSNCINLSSIFFFNVSSVELEYKNLNLCIQKNKINELKYQFQGLIKKEKYWRQKGITLNRIR